MTLTRAQPAEGSCYVELGPIACGGMAEVHLARREGPAGFRKLVALKRVLPKFVDDLGFERMFLNEARLAAGLEHSNLVRVLDFGILEDRYFLAMEYVHGHDLRAVLHQAAKTLPEGVLPLESAIYVVRSVAAGLHHAHERCGDDGRPLGLVHRDVSPSNVLLSDEGEVKLSDFGIAKATGSGDVTATTTIRGKLAYMSPEQARGEALDRRADVFALGIILFEVTTGYRQFSGDNQYQLINRVADGTITLPRELVPDYPPQLEAIVARALASDREGRYQTALELHDALGQFTQVHGLHPEGPKLGRLVVSMFGRRPMPTLDPSREATVPLGPSTRPIPVEDDEPAPAPVPRRGRWVAMASLVLGIGVGVAVTRTTAPDETEPRSEPSPVPVAGSDDASDGAPDRRTRPPRAGPDARPGLESETDADAQAAATSTDSSPSRPPDSRRAADDPSPRPAATRRRKPPKRRRKPPAAAPAPAPAPAPSLDDWALPQK